MKKILFIIILLATSWANAQTHTACHTSSKEKNKRSVIIMNPTIKNIETFIYLTENGILTQINDFEAIGFYHKKQNYDFGKSQKYINKNNLAIKLVKCEANLLPENIYTHNDASSLFTDIFNKTEGVFFFGGSDIPTQTFNQQTHLMTSISDPYRNFFELSFAFHLLGGTQNPNQTALLEKKPNYVIAGFCLGLQTINCATGGTLYQDIPMQVYGLSTAEEVLAHPSDMHKNYRAYFDYDNKLNKYIFHQIKPAGNNIFSQLMGNNNPYVLSYHHQAVENIGKDFELAATSMDGKIIEALVHKKYPHVIGTQFHPESTAIYNNKDTIRSDFDTIHHQPYAGLYCKERGETFHLDFWLTIGKWLNNQKKYISH